jgi:hypothetical protein
MRRFRDLLKPEPQFSPKEQQDRASAGLADAVEQSHMRWWRKGESAPCRGKRLLLAVAPYSQYDLTLLDVIDESLGSGRSVGVEVYVVNLRDYDSVEQLAVDFPGVGAAPQTPLAAVWDDGSEKAAACGKKARDLAAEALGIPADDLSERIKAEAPNYTNAAG